MNEKVIEEIIKFLLKKENVVFVDGKWSYFAPYCKQFHSDYCYYTNKCKKRYEKECKNKIEFIRELNILLKENKKNILYEKN